MKKLLILNIILVVSLNANIFNYANKDKKNQNNYAIMSLKDMKKFMTKKIKENGGSKEAEECVKKAKIKSKVYACKRYLK
jgi:peroxiredoxin family protein